MGNTRLEATWSAEPRGQDHAGPTSWRLERSLGQVSFTRCAELSVFSETRSARMSAPHAHPAWTFLLPVDGGTVTVVAEDTVRVHNGVLLAPQSHYRAATDGPHVAVYANAWTWARPESQRLRILGASSARRVLDALDIDNGTDLSAAVTELTPLVGRIGPIDSRLALVVEGLPAADRLDVVAGEVGISPSRLRSIAHEEIGVPLTAVVALSTRDFVAALRTDDSSSSISGRVR
jgi:hypothetical protein